MTYLYKQIYNSSELYHDLKRMGRDNFTYEGAKALQEYLEQLAEDMGEPIEYVPVAFCCDYAEYKNLDDFNKSDGYEYATLDDLRDNTAVIEFDGGIIVASH